MESQNMQAIQNTEYILNNKGWNYIYLILFANVLEFSVNTHEVYLQFSINSLQIPEIVLLLSEMKKILHH